MNAKVNVPVVTSSFPVRRMDFDFKNVPHYWFGGDAGLTHFMTAMSALFPEGEQFFVDSVRAVRYHPLVKDNLLLQKEISAFIGQEAMHSKEHEAFNAVGNQYGYNMHRLEQITRQFIDLKRFVFFADKDMVNLSATCALEHFTATIAAELMRRSDLQEQIQDPVMYKLWMWHAVEENEHKSVAFDVYNALYGKTVRGYAMRSLAMGLATVLILIAQTYFMSTMMRKDGLMGVRHWGRAVKTMYGRNGFFTNMLPEFLDYFRPSFHPNDHDTVALLASWKDKLEFLNVKPQASR
jgi:predicted metal-dependent hydrolase